MNADGPSNSVPLLIQTRAPFDLSLTVGALRRLPSSALYPLVGDEFRVVAALPSGPRLLAVRSDSAAPDTLLCTSLGEPLTPNDADAARNLIVWMLGADRDLTSVMALLEREPALAPLAQRLAGLKPPRFPSLWEAFCQIVPFQQVSLSAALSILNRFTSTLGTTIPFDGVDYYALPTPQAVLAVDEAAARSCGLSAAKVHTLRSVAQQAVEGRLERADFLDLPDEEAVARLTSIPGIGPWSSQVALLRGLGRLSVFPSGDSGAARALKELFVESEQPEVEARALFARLGPWRGYLYFVLLGRRLLALRDAGESGTARKR